MTLAAPAPTFPSVGKLIAIAAAIVVVLIAVAGVGLVFSPSVGERRRPGPDDPDFRRDLVITSSSMRNGGDGMYALWTVSLRNRSARFAYTGIELTATYQTPDGERRFTRPARGVALEPVDGDTITDWPGGPIPLTMTTSDIAITKATGTPARSVP